MGDGQKFIKKGFEIQKEKIKELLKDKIKCYRKANDCTLKSKTYTNVRKEMK